MAIAVFKVGTRRTIFSFYLFIVIYMVGGYLLDRQLELFKIQLSDGTGSTTGWLTPLNPFLALESIFNNPNYSAPYILTLPPELRGWPFGTMLSRPAQFYTSFMFLLSFVLVMPSIVLLRRLAQSTTSFKSAILQKLRLSRGDRNRKPRYVWANPIAWREAKTKASAARASFLRFGFMAAGLFGALFLAWQFASVIEPDSFIDQTSYNSSQRTLTVYSKTRDPQTYRLARDAGATATLNGKQLSLDDIQGRLAVTLQTQTLQAPPGRPAPTVLSSVSAREISRRVSAPDVRMYLLGMAIVEFAVILLIVTNAAASTVTREKEDGTLDILLTSPITSRYYIWGQLRGLVSFVLPLILVPVVSVGVFVVYDIARRFGHWNDPTFQWIVLPESIILMPAMLIIVVAFAAIVGMQMSLRCRTTVMAVMSSVGIVVGVCAAMGWCGYGVLDNGNNEIALVLGSFSPFTIMMLLINPYYFAGGLFGVDNYGMDKSDGSRVLMFAFTIVAVGAYTAVVWSMYRSMVKNFDMTIRRQSR
jgi:ABC-type Na+ efflux pump permease subunit